MPPEPLEIGAKRAEPSGIDLIDAAIAVGPVDDQSRILEHPQVLRDGGTAHRELAGELADRPWALGEALEDGAPRRIS